jgi:hypothetical protein
MRCVSWGHDVQQRSPTSSSTGRHSGWMTKEVSCPADLTNPQQQDTPVISAAAWLGQWVKDNVQENRPRRLASQQGLQLGKSRYRNARAGDSGRYGLATAEQDGASRGNHLQVNPADGITLDEGEMYLVDGTIRAEIMEYLSQTYGPVFVEDLIKHLPQSG